VGLAKQFAGRPNVVPSRMLGFPTFYASSKLSVCLYDNGVGLKGRSRSLASSGASSADVCTLLLPIETSAELLRTSTRPLRHSDTVLYNGARMQPPAP
jgi:hypothetical protein